MKQQYEDHPLSPLGQSILQKVKAKYGLPPDTSQGDTIIAFARVGPLDPKYDSLTLFECAFMTELLMRTPDGFTSDSP